MSFNQGSMGEIITVALSDRYFIGRGGSICGELGEVYSSGDFIYSIVKYIFVDADYKTECFLCFSSLLFCNLFIIIIIINNNNNYLFDNIATH